MLKFIKSIFKPQIRYRPRPRLRIYEQALEGAEPISSATHYPTEIISSHVHWDLRQVDGRRNVREIHCDDLGDIYVFDYMAQDQRNLKKALRKRVEELNNLFKGH